MHRFEDDDDSPRFEKIRKRLKPQWKGNGKKPVKEWKKKLKINIDKSEFIFYK
jgi:hypothetical protein